MKVEDLLQRAIVRIDIDGIPNGTGFFVVPGHVLTCAHVISPATLTSPDPLSAAPRAKIQVCDRAGREHEITTDPSIDSKADLAWLSLPGAPPDVPVPLISDGMVVGDELWTYGFPLGKTAGVPVTFDAEGMAEGPPPLLKFKGGQVQDGLSGAPLLNRRTGAVCGIIRRTRNEETDLGGYAIPVKDFETCKFYRNLRRFILLAGGADPRWLDLLSSKQLRYIHQLDTSDVELVINVAETVNHWKASGTLFTTPDRKPEDLGRTSIDLNRVRGDVARLFRAWKTQRRIGDKEQARLLGQVLYRAALPDQFAAELESRVFGSPGGKVNISLCFAPKIPQDLVHLPWEQLYVPDTEMRVGVALGMDRRTTLTRVLAAEKSFSYPYPTADNMRILLIEAPAPQDDAAAGKPAFVDSHQVAATVSAVLEKYPDQISVTSEGVVSRDRLHATIRAHATHAFTVVHYVGYARFNRAEDELALWDTTSDDKSKVDWVGEYDFAALFDYPSPQLVVLQACTGPGSDRNLVPGDLTVLAKRLLRQGVQAVIACQFPIPDIQAAKDLIGSLYAGLVAGKSVRTAVQEARDQLSERPWTQPALFAQHPGDLYLLPRPRPQGIAIGPSTGSTSGRA